MENKRELRENITEFVGKLNTLQKQYYNLRQENQNYKNQLQSSQVQKKQRQILDAQIEEIKDLRNKDLSFRAISKKTNRSVFTISRVLNGFYDQYYICYITLITLINKKLYLYLLSSTICC